MVSEHGTRGGGARGCRRRWQQKLATVTMSPAGPSGNIYGYLRLFTYSFLNWIAINNRDLNIYNLTNTFYG
jgi:hypothetical protein